MACKEENTEEEKGFLWFLAHYLNLAYVTANCAYASAFLHPGDMDVLRSVCLLHDKLYELWAS